VRLCKEGEVYAIQVRDEPPQTLTREAYIEQYVKPASLVFSEDFSHAFCTADMAHKLDLACMERFGESIFSSPKRSSKAESELEEALNNI